MIAIIRSQPTATAVSKFLDASVILRDDKRNGLEGFPDIVFSIATYQKIARNDGNLGELILLPINLFFNTLSFDDHKRIYEMYAFAKSIVNTMTKENRRYVQDTLQMAVFDVIRQLDLPKKMIAFCRTDRFEYPELDYIGNKPHHNDDKTYNLEHYIHLTAVSLLSKMMVPIWGEFVRILAEIGILNDQREKIAFDLIEPSLEENAFEDIYTKLSKSIALSISEDRKSIDKKPVGNASTSFILTHNGFDDQMFNSVVMANIVMKKMATYECLSRLKDGNIPNVMFYIYDGIKKTAETRLKTMRGSMNSMPRRELPSYEIEDNSSILDHSSQTSNKPFDVPIFVNIAVTHYEFPKLLLETNTPMDVFNSAKDYYTTNHFDVSPMTQAVVASFIGTRFGGSKCLGYLPAPVYQQLVVMTQIFLIKQNMIDLATMISSKTSQTTLDGVNPSSGLRVTSNLKTSEYLQCQDLFKGFLEKNVIPIGKKVTSRKPETSRIDFVSHIDRMKEWLIRYSHVENMAPSLWEFAKIENRPEIGSECKFDENIIRNLCHFYLLMHRGDKPF